jgi:predicted nucleic acid-binding protein
VVAGPRLFLDTSVLISGLIELEPPSDAAQRIMARVASGRLDRPQTAWHCCLEFYAVSTRLPLEFRLSPADAWHLIEDELLGRFVVRQLPADHHAAFLRSAADGRLRGGRIYDAHIAEIARVSGASLVVTDNARDFAGLRRHGVEVMTSREFAETLPA